MTWFLTSWFCRFQTPYPEEDLFVKTKTKDDITALDGVVVDHLKAWSKGHFGTLRVALFILYPS